ncbi:MAG: hypothetical protein EBQ72_05550 [Actinobacteria bacterium]|nr:hypothetical protein [Actinomycetota bacterium]
MTASKALGYAQVLDFLNGEITEAEAKERTISSTRRYVRRQESWFNRDSRIQWLEADSESLLSQVKALVQPEPAAQ